MDLPLLTVDWPLVSVDSPKGKNLLAIGNISREMMYSGLCMALRRVIDLGAQTTQALQDEDVDAPDKTGQWFSVDDTVPGDNTGTH
jgi:hypothetical protein